MANKEVSQLLTEITADNTKFKQKVAESTKAVQDFGKKTNQTLSNISKTFGVAFGATAIVSTFRSISQGIDDMTTSARKLNISVESFQALQYAAKRSDVELSTLEMGIKRLRTTLALAASGNQTAAQSFSKLGLDARKLANENIDEVYAKIGKAIQGLNSTQQVEAVTGLFGARQGQEQLLLLRANITGLIQEAKDLRVVLDKDTLAKFDELDKVTDQVATKVKSSLRDAFLSLAEPIILISNLVIKFVDALSLIPKGFSSIGNLVQTLRPTEQDPKKQGFLSNQLEGTINRVSRTMDIVAGFISGQGEANAGQTLYNKSNLPKNTVTNQLANVPVVDVRTEFGKLASAASSASGALNKIGTTGLKDLFGVSDNSNLGKEYLSSILTPLTQATDPMFTKIANELRDIVATGGNTNSVAFQSGLQNLKLIAQYNKPGQLDSYTNTGMNEAIKAIEQYAKEANAKKNNEVTVIIKVKDNEFISAVVDSTKFAKAVVDQAVIAADNSARAINR